MVGILLIISSSWAFAAADKPEEELPSLYVTAGTGLNLRSGPSTEFDVIITAPCGREVFEIEKKNGWVHISLHKTNRDSLAWASEKYLARIEQECPELYSCHDCGRRTTNSPGVFGYSMCNNCTKLLNDEASSKLNQIESGRAYKCEFCGAYAARGKGMCNSCIKEAGKLLGGGG